MNILPFTIISYNKGQQIDEKIPMLINLDQLVSIKPIKVPTSEGEVLDGYWIRLTNDKKYRAIQIPKLLKDMLNSDLLTEAKDVTEDSVH